MDALFFLSNNEFFLAIRDGPYMTPFEDPFFGNQER